MVPFKAGTKVPGYRPERTIADFVLGLPNAMHGAAGKGAKEPEEEEEEVEEGEEEEGEEGEEAGRVLRRRRAGALVREQQSGLVIVESSEQFSAVWGRPPFFAPDTANAAIEDLLLLHTRCACTSHSLCYMTCASIMHQLQEGTESSACTLLACITASPTLHPPVVERTVRSWVQDCGRYVC